MTFITFNTRSYVLHVIRIIKKADVIFDWTLIAKVFKLNGSIAMKKGIRTKCPNSKIQRVSVQKAIKENLLQITYQVSRSWIEFLPLYSGIIVMDN